MRTYQLPITYPHSGGQTTKYDGNKDIPYAPTTEERLRVMIRLAGDVKGKKTIDLGAGDGRVVISMAKGGAKAYGVEIDPEMIKTSRDNIEKENVKYNATILEQSIWNTDLSDYDVITLYGITSIMEKLEKKLKDELKSGAKVISNYFTFPDWEPIKEKGEVRLYIQP